MYSWNETVALKRPDEVLSCLHAWTVEEKQVRPNLTTIIFWADGGYIAATRVLC
jgi:hypothetical protein